MAKAYPAGKDGLVALGVGSAMDCMSIDLTENQATESVAAYGTPVYDPYRGSGTPHQQVTVGGFATTGVALSQPGFGNATGGTAASAGATATLTIATAATFAGPYVMSSLKIASSRIKAAVPVTVQLDNSGDITTTWAVT